jgi:hypothetical protein
MKTTVGRIHVVVVLLFMGSSLVNGYSSFPVTGACGSQIPGHRINARPDDGGYSLSFPNNMTWKPGGNNLVVTLTAATTGYMGLLMSAFGSGGVRYGSFYLTQDELFNNDPNVPTFRQECGGKAVSHADPNDKETRDFNWIPPSTPGLGTMTFKATVVRDFGTFYLISETIDEGGGGGGGGGSQLFPDPPINLTVSVRGASTFFSWIQVNGTLGIYNLFGFELQQANNGSTTDQFTQVMTVTGTNLHPTNQTFPEEYNARLFQPLVVGDVVFRVRSITQHDSNQFVSDWSDVVLVSFDQLCG